MLDSLNHAIMKENEIPKIIDIIFKKINGSLSSDTIDTFNKHMRTAKEILKDYGL